MNEFQVMLDFFLSLFREVPDVLMSFPFFYFFAIIIGYYAVGMFILLFNNFKRRR